MDNEQDIALQALLEVHQKNSSLIDLELLKDCYRIEKKYQYEKDQEFCLDEIQRLIAKEVDKELNEE
jgi:hypothetical protein